MSPYRIQRLGIAYLPEGRGIFRRLSVDDNLKMAIRRIRGRAQRSRARDRAFELFPALSTRRQQQAATLSGGEQQMLALARALIIEPRVIVADEVSLGLAPILVEAVFEALQVMKQEGVTMIVIDSLPKEH